MFLWIITSASGSIIYPLQHILLQERCRNIARNVPETLQVNCYVRPCATLREIFLKHCFGILQQWSRCTNVAIAIWHGNVCAIFPKRCTNVAIAILHGNVCTIFQEHCTNVSIAIFHGNVSTMLQYFENLWILLLKNHCILRKNNCLKWHDRSVINFNRYSSSTWSYSKHSE